MDVQRLLGSTQLTAEGVQCGLSFPALLQTRATVSVMYIPQAAKVVAFLPLKASFGESL